ncbi:chitobiase/beta-hexosaminidase C-terminal domain-containing protein [Acidicapsa dinghuensis]|uniref:Chitobiase/beta-hexosaminidase C-terminal domain-containing protein n=1 Tax=Acidicapsa dinghuensis TaxID=2218256 RepID=A0ABW1EPN8_9BACT|nr:chitobiase/beta-hexosaminidase C-terminal domain-containing protein [Acidicapsa dinghuensis]
MSGQTKPASPSIAKNYGKLPLSFEVNQGQADPQVRFLSRGNGYSLFLTDKEAVLTLRKTEMAHSAASLNPAHADADEGSDASFRSDVVRMQLAGARSRIRVAGADKLPGTANYFIGNDPAQWHSDVPTFGKVEYEGVYPGVDLVYYGNQQQLEYDFVVAPNADVKTIRLRFAGAKRLMLDANGDLEIIAANGQITFRKPIAYQQKDEARLPVNGHFTLLADGAVGFAVGTYDRSKPLVIDPTLSYSTYLGGSNGASYGTAIAVDSSGNAYVTGVVYATNFPATSGSYQTSNNESASTFDAFVAKLNPTGTALVYATYLGGSGNTSVAGTLNHGDYPTGIRVDGSGEAYVAGIAYSVDFPVTSTAFQKTNEGGANGVSNGFVTKINAAGSGLVYSTYLGGSGITGYAGKASLNIPGPGGDGCASIAIDASGDAYVTGTAYSTNFPVTGSAYQATNKSASTGHPNAFVAEVNPQGTALDYATYLGGSTGDGGSGIAVDSGGDVYVDGATYSTDFPIVGALQGTNKTLADVGSNGFVTKLNSTLSSLVYSTYLGGSGNANGPSGNNNGDAALGIALDSANNAYVYGLTSSQDFPVTAGVLQSSNKAFASGAPNYFIAKVNPSGSDLVYATYLGGSQPSLSPGSNGLAVDSSGDAYITGYVLATDFPVSSNAYQTSPACALATSGSVTEYTSPVLSEINSSGTALLYSTYFGGTGGPVSVVEGTSFRTCDYGYGISVDSQGNAYLTGSAVSSNFPTTSGAFQTTNPANGSAFISKFLIGTSSSKTSTTTTLVSSGSPAAAGTDVTFTATVTPGSGTGTPTGMVAFSVDGGAATSETLSGGKATYSTSTLAVGSHTIMASYSGDSSYTASRASISESITGASSGPDTISIVSGSGQSATVGTAFAAPLVVVVKDGSGNPASGVSVSFIGIGITFSSASVTTGANGTAETTATPTASGTFTVTANIGGVNNFVKFMLTGVGSGTTQPSGIITTVAGTGTAGFTGDSGQATGAELNTPWRVTKDIAGNLYIADTFNSRIRKVNAATGVITTVAGNGIPGYSGDGGPATSAELDYPYGIGVDSAGDLYIADTSNHRIRKVNAATGTITTVAGDGTAGNSGDGGPATSGEMTYPYGIAIDASGNIYTSDWISGVIRKVTASTGVISTVAGNGGAGYAGDGGPATSATLYYPVDVAVDGGGNVYIADTDNYVVRKVSAATGIITTVAGKHTYGYSGDGGSATSSELGFPEGVSLDSAGNLYIADVAANVVREVTATTGVINTVAGSGSPGYSGDSGPATSATLNTPEGVVANPAGGGFLIADAINNRIRAVQYQVASPAFSPAAGTYTSVQSVTITDTTAGATIYFTTNGTTPTAASTKYTGAITVGSTETIEAIAVASGYANSAVASAVYTINLPPSAAAMPTFSPAAGTYTSAQSVTIADSTSGAVIYYTTNGSTPTTSSTKYSGAITVGSTETLEAIAVAPGYSNSAVAEAAYTINLPSPTFSLAASPTSTTISSGQSAKFTLTVTPQNGFNQVVNFSCSGLPSGDSCSFSPSQVTPAGAAVTSTMTISSSSNAANSRLLLWEKAGGGLALALVLWPFNKRRSWHRLVLALLLIGGLTVIGCGGTTKPQSYSVSVSASGGGVSQMTSVSLTVTK